MARSRSPFEAPAAQVEAPQAIDRKRSWPNWTFYMYILGVVWPALLLEADYWLADDGQRQPPLIGGTWFLIFGPALSAMSVALSNWSTRASVLWTLAIPLFALTSIVLYMFLETTILSRPFPLVD